VLPYVEPDVLLLALELLVSFEVGLVEAVVFRLPLVFSFVVLVLELGLVLLVLPKVESVLEDEDGVALLDPEVLPVEE